jgi:hypothetical protein
MLIFVSGHYPIYGKQVLYFVDPEFAKRAAEPPPRAFYAIEEGKVRRQRPLDLTANILSKAELLPAEDSKTDGTNARSSADDAFSLDAYQPDVAMTASRAATPSIGFVEQLELDRHVEPPRSTSTQRKEL